MLKLLGLAAEPGLRRTGRKTAWLTSAATRAARAQCAPSRALTAKATSVVAISSPADVFRVCLHAATSPPP